ncbi:hypothetical protein L596_016049 [Steinernema carpocapsae]|uniref:Uncharacterized protein n=1 Tax=Steinernema carpocapsae TaxID=34508 RepID=A0A4U5NGV0_STECR|nr:hypothetical protein L596_016049 [Steinernema carpocapsae]
MSALRLAAVFAVAACVALGSAAELEEFNKSFRVEYREKSGEAWKIVNVTGAFRHFHVFYETAMRLQTEGHEHCTFFSAVWAQLDISFYWIIPKLGTKELTPDEQKKFTDLKNSCSDKTPKKQDGEGDKTTADYDNRLPTKRTLVILTLVFGSLACCQLGTVLTILLIACFYKSSRCLPLNPSRGVVTAAAVAVAAATGRSARTVPDARIARRRPAAPRGIKTAATPRRSKAAAERKEPQEDEPEIGLHCDRVNLIR